METGALSYMPHHRTSQGVINNISLMDLVTLSDLGVARGDNVSWSTIKTMILMMINILQRAAQHPPLDASFFINTTHHTHKHSSLGYGGMTHCKAH